MKGEEEEEEEEVEEEERKVEQRERGKRRLQKSLKKELGVHSCVCEMYHYGLASCFIQHARV
jgi:hypothetical protein